MKKILAVVLSLVMMFAVCVPAFAVHTITDKTEGNSADSKVYTSTTPAPDFVAYTVSIPAETQIAWGTTKTAFNYSVKTQLELGKRLAVSVVSQSGTQELKNASTDKTLPYTFSYTNQGGIVNTLSYTTDTEVIDTNRTFNIDIASTSWQAAPIAEYEGYLTFTVEVVDAAEMA